MSCAWDGCSDDTSPRGEGEFCARIHWAGMGQSLFDPRSSITESADPSRAAWLGTSDRANHESHPRRD